jgi:hypothetical protein
VKKHLLLLACITVVNCSQVPEIAIDHLEGYWQISSVNKDGKLLKEFSINTNIDYFEVSDDSTGFRKKVSPILTGKFTVSQHQTPFTLKSIDGNLQIHYSSKGVKYRETLVSVDQNTLIIKNDEGFVYTYKPYTKFDFN